MNPMVSVSELLKIENILRQGEHGGDRGKVCKEYIGKIRRWLASGESPADVRRKLELLVARFGNVRY
jgi:hypothetical protein